MKWIYAGLCLVGAVLPYAFFAPFIAAHGLDLPLMLNQLFATPTGAFFGVDVVVSALALWAWIFAERRARRVPGWWLPILATLAVGVSLGLPLYLLLRELDAATQAGRTKTP